MTADAHDDRALIARQPALVQRAMEPRGEDLPPASSDSLWWPRLTAWWHDAETTPEDWRMAANSLRRIQADAPQRWWLLASWLAWGVACPQPAMGALAIVRRRDRPFVGWVAWAHDAGRLVVLTAALGARVLMLPRVDRQYVQGLRWPAESQALMAGYAMRWVLAQKEGA